MEQNFCTMTDSYKFGHWGMLTEDTEQVYAYSESRLGSLYPATVYVGLQMLLKDFFTGEVITEKKITKGMNRVNRHIGEGTFNINGWNHILKNRDGKLPLRIKAVPEGTVVPIGNVLMTIENTDAACPWLTGHSETILTHTWAPTTVATASYFAKQMMKKYLAETSCNPDAINFMLHDFGFRGVSSLMSAAQEGVGHLVNFMGTDTFPAVEAAMDYYNLSDDEMPAYSVLATEHSIMTLLGRDGEMAMLGRLLNKFPKGILSIVIDSYNYKEFIEQAFKQYGDLINNRDGKIVFRPDSGSPSDVTVDCYERIKKYAGYTINEKGYEVLNPKTGLLWGDGIDVHGIESILYVLKMRNVAAENMVFGMGGGLLQKINRDTQRFAFKASYNVRGGVGYDQYKDPIDGGKTSKKGRLALIRNEDGNIVTVDEREISERGGNLLETVFENGELIRDMKFDEVRANSNM